MTADRTPAILACMRDAAEEAARSATDQQATVDALTAHAALCIATDDVTALALAPFTGIDEAHARGLLDVLAGRRPPVTAEVDVVTARRVATRLACVALACAPYNGQHGPEAVWMWDAARRLGGFAGESSAQRDDGWRDACAVLEARLADIVSALGIPVRGGVHARVTVGAFDAAMARIDTLQKSSTVA